MAKPPLMGRVKTRLSRDIGTVGAAQFYRHAVERLLRRLQVPREWNLRLAVNARPEDSYQCWPRDVIRMPQGGGSLGQRMGFVLDNLPPGPAVIIGTDSPQIEPEHIREAFHALGRDDAVFGPSDDGGYWLIGLARRRPAPRLFEDVAWSTDTALDDTIASLPESFRISEMSELIDVDNRDDLEDLNASWGPMRYGPWRPLPEQSDGAS
ncbi:TIGR04282 family arsenosugar biosynthesis glycosyltransferase [Parvularcula marina]|uniref:TIGR04282 family arsenosugar biosynthesis glycosyltransferase n=1 Tax=Parvularcula marina TaxID=2292771 RepID=UPI003515BE63